MSLNGSQISHLLPLSLEALADQKERALWLVLIGRDNFFSLNTFTRL